jgi:hypothetical protein
MGEFRHELKAKELNIVLIGGFNPVIINPNWLAGKELITDQEAKIAKEAENFVTHPEVSQFKLPHCNIQVTKDRFIISSTEESYFDNLQSLTTEIFTYLGETPITQMGINITHHYGFAKADEWNKFGDLLAPKQIWSQVTEKPGLKQLTIMSERKDGLAGEINTTVGISGIFPDRGISIQVNDHYDFYTYEEKSQGKYINASRSLKVLEVWQQKLDYTSRIIDGIINYEQK